MRSLCLFVVLPILVQCSATNLKQEAAVVLCCNTKYVEECYSITRRNGRGEPYKTNLTTVTRYEWNNNVTLKVVLHSGFPIEVVKVKLCEVSKIAWLAEYLKVYSKGYICPVGPGPLGLYNMELPPKHFPQSILNVLKDKNRVSFQVVVTATEEVIIENSITVG